MDGSQKDINGARQGGIERRQTVAAAIWGGLVIAGILLATTVWALSSARAGTDRAVNVVSGFYLEELAGRLEADSRRQGRVYQAVGLSGGAFLVILLL